LLDSFDPPAQSQGAGVPLGSSSPSPIDPLGLRHGNFHDRWDAAKQVLALGDEALGELMALVQDQHQDWESLWFAARSLGHFDRPEVVAVLIDSFRTTEDEDVRGAIAAALSQIGPSAIAALTELLPHPDHRDGAVQTLAQIHHPATKGPLLAAFPHTQGSLRAVVVEALGQFAHADLLPVMTTALQDQSPVVRRAALRGLISLKGHLSPPQWVATLTPGLTDPNLAVAQQAVAALGRSAEPTATSALLHLLNNHSTAAPLKVTVVQALSWQATPPAVAGLIQAWDRSEAVVRLAIVQGLSRLTAPELKPQLTPPLIQWLTALPPTAPQSTLRRNLVITLGQLGGPEAIPLLHSLLDDRDESVQLHAAAALKIASPGPSLTG
jgi:HEAT repeat protein